MWSCCQLDSDNNVDLHKILRVFSAPITEEHAWALVHQVGFWYFPYDREYMSNESILIRNEFIPIWYEFILSQCMYFTKSVLEQLRITLDKKFFWGLIVIKKCDFLKLFLHLNSEV